jgi:hypothetical protein
VVLAEQLAAAAEVDKGVAAVVTVSMEKGAPAVKLKEAVEEL